VALGVFAGVAFAERRARAVGLPLATLHGAIGWALVPGFALAHLVALVREQGVPIIDCQQETAHLASLGARPIPRARFAAILRELIHSAAPPPGWRPGAPGGKAP